jgi:phospholipase C
MPEGRVANATYDHTSLLATVRKIFRLTDFLTKRDAAANTFDNIFLPAARKTTDTPANLSLLVRRRPGLSVVPQERGLSEYQRSLVALAAALEAPRSEQDAAAQVAAMTGKFLAGVQAP